MMIDGGPPTLPCMYSYLIPCHTKSHLLPPYAAANFHTPHRRHSEASQKAMAQFSQILGSDGGVGGAGLGAKASGSQKKVRDS